MAKKGLANPKMTDGWLSYRLVLFIMGIYEDQLQTIDHEPSHLVWHCLAEGGAEGIMNPYPPVQRVIPAHSMMIFNLR